MIITVASGKCPDDTVVTEAMVPGRPVTEYAGGPVVEAIGEIWLRVRDRLL